MPDSYDAFKKEYLKLSGIDLHSYKESQMKRRIDNFIIKCGNTGYQDFLLTLKSDKKIYKEFVTYLTINVSEFYRNPTQWRTLESAVFPRLVQKFGKRLNIWSAACSTGDEPYSLAMVLSDFVPLEQIHILATDLDDEVLEKAKIGRYSEKSMKGLPKKYQDKFMVSDGAENFRVSDKLKSCITFKQHNLLRDPYPKDLHMIVCRNVMIYFTEEAKKEIYHKFSASLCQNGILFVGSTEQIIGASQYGFRGIESFFYEKQ